MLVNGSIVAASSISIGCKPVRREEQLLIGQSLLAPPSQRKMGIPEAVGSDIIMSPTTVSTSRAAPQALFLPWLYSKWEAPREVWGPQECPTFVPTTPGASHAHLHRPSFTCVSFKDVLLQLKVPPCHGKKKLSEEVIKHPRMCSGQHLAAVRGQLTELISDRKSKYSQAQ